MTALPSAHVFDADPDSLLFLEPGKVIEGMEKGRKGAILQLFVGEIPGVDYEMVCTYAVADREHVTKLIYRSAPYPLADRCDVDFA